MLREVKVGTVSWINETPHPVTLAAEAKILKPEWVVKTYVGLVATSNPAPGEREEDFFSLQKGRNFRALTFARVTFEEDDAKQAAAALRGQIDFERGSGRPTDAFSPIQLGLPSLQVRDAILDPGWTPPFAMSKFPSSVLSFDMDVYSTSWHRGEMSPRSMIVTGKRHPNTTIAGVPNTEVVLVNGIMKIRAGKHIDDIGINSVKAPNHVPWVWCEVLVTWAAGNIKLYGRGSLFPSHAWYLDGKRVARSQQLGDTSFPKRLLVSRWVPRMPGGPGVMNLSVPTNIEVDELRLYPVLVMGPPAKGPQTALDADAKLTTHLETHPHTVPGVGTFTN